MRKWIQLALLVLCFFCLSGAALAASAVTPDGYFNGIRLAGKVRVVDFGCLRSEHSDHTGPRIRTKK